MKSNKSKERYIAVIRASPERTRINGKKAIETMIVPMAVSMIFSFFYFIWRYADYLGYLADACEASPPPPSVWGRSCCKCLIRRPHMKWNGAYVMPAEAKPPTTGNAFVTPWENRLLVDMKAHPLCDLLDHVVDRVVRQRLSRKLLGRVDGYMLGKFLECGCSGPVPQHGANKHRDQHSSLIVDLLILFH